MKTVQTSMKRDVRVVAANIDSVGPTTRAFLVSSVVEDIAGFLLSEMHVKTAGVAKLHSQIADQSDQSMVLPAVQPDLSQAGGRERRRCSACTSRSHTLSIPSRQGSPVLTGRAPINFVTVYLTCKVGITGTGEHADQVRGSGLVTSNDAECSCSRGQFLQWTTDPSRSLLCLSLYTSRSRSQPTTAFDKAPAWWAAVEAIRACGKASGERWCLRLRGLNGNS